MKKAFARFLIFAAVILVAAFLFVNYAVYSEGTRAGVVIKVSKKGVFFKTWEGQLNLQSFGAVKSDNSFAEVFSFSVEDGEDEIYEELQDVSLTGERVNLHYKQKYMVLPWKGDSKFFIVKIDRVQDKKKEKEQVEDQPEEQTDAELREDPMRNNRGGEEL